MAAMRASGLSASTRLRPTQERARAASRMPKTPCASAAPPPPPPAPPSALEANADAAMDAKDSATLAKDTLSKTANLSAVDATMQLRVLCRKFAALTEKVKDETRIREEAEREVRRLKALLEGNDAPVIASTRSEAHALIKELKESQERLKQELRQEKEKNALLVSRALELEKEKNALLSSTSAVALHGVNNRTSTGMVSAADRYLSVMIES
ncbi:hypothetical protein P43SY_000271 [Pythium insidiosum]|uniref:Uncharacterized protein n=1 Tax=Pythium insidiosum TaxID=114742 RepID=A0AAD5MF35_PYTIN|nr:hypothetical protein P43SY_000271 [Pythium insidiosum]